MLSPAKTQKTVVTAIKVPKANSKSLLRMKITNHIIPKRADSMKMNGILSAPRKVEMPVSSQMSPPPRPACLRISI